MNHPLALDDVKILDLTTEIGAYCTKLFADLGADVLKVEPPCGDRTRRLGPFYHDRVSEETSLYYFFMNTNKKSITLNIETPDGQAIFKKLVKEYDVIVDNFPPGYLDELGLGYQALSALNSKVIMTSITLFGQDGPYKDYKATDIVGVAMGGLMYLAGYPDTPPVRPYGNQSYYAASLYGAVGTIIALYHRDFSQEGQHIDVSMQESIALALENSAQFYDLQGLVRKRMGMAGSQAGYGLYPCADGYVYVMIAGIGGNRFWDKFVQWFADEQVEGWEKLNDPKWQDLEWRQSEEGKNEFRRIFMSFSMKKNKLEIYEEGQSRQLAICPVNDPKDLFSNPQLKERGFFTRLKHDHLDEEVVYPGAPYILSETPWSLRTAAPTKGMHNSEIYRKIGFTVAELVSMKEGGII